MFRICFFLIGLGSCLFAEVDKKLEEQQQVASARRAIALLKTKGDETILEVGCGEGYAASLLAFKVPLGEVIAIDSSPTKIDEATRKFIQANLTFREMNPLTLKYENTFDLIVSFSTLQGNSDQVKILKKLHTALKPSGRIVLQVPSSMAPEMEEASKIIIDKSEWKGYFKHYKPSQGEFKAEEYRDFLKEANLNCTKIMTTLQNTSFTSKEAFREFLKKSLSYAEAIPAEKKDQFLDEVIALYVEKKGLDARGNYQIFGKKLLVEAEKSTSQGAMN